MRKRLNTGVAIACGLALITVTAVSVAGASSSTRAATRVATSQGCDIGRPGNKIDHVIYLQFDNTHLFRDRQQFASDLELIPSLKNFLSENGTLSDNEHTILISHTAG
jgi:hypothetical protein